MYIATDGRQALSSNDAYVWNNMLSVGQKGNANYNNGTVPAYF